MQHWLDEAGCAQAAARLARHPALGAAFIELHGPLGAGKTTFARHLLQALGITGRIKSPTYAILEVYRTSLGRVGRVAGDRAKGAADDFDVHHFDFYRFDDPQEWEDAGFRDVFAGPGLKLAEWPERAAGLLPPADLSIAIEPLDGAADLSIAIEPLDGEADLSIAIEPLDGAAARQPSLPPRRVRVDALSALGRELLR